MDFLEIVKKSRSYRGFDNSCPVTKETLTALVNCARFAPTGGNLQPLKFFLSADAETNALIQKHTRWAAKLAGQITLPLPGHAPSGFILILVDTRILPNPEAAGKDVGIAAQTILLAAAAEGLGGCMIGAFDKAVREALALDSHLFPSLILAVGKPDETVVLEDAAASIDYYRTPDGVHHVPKRPLDELIVS